MQLERALDDLEVVQRLRWRFEPTPFLSVEHSSATIFIPQLESKEFGINCFDEEDLRRMGMSPNLKELFFFSPALGLHTSQGVSEVSLQRDSRLRQGRFLQAESDFKSVSQ